MAVAMRTSELRMVSADNQTIADLDAIQGMWSTEQYLKLTDYSPKLIEFTDGVIEVLPMPTDRHQDILLFLNDRLRELLHPHGGKVMVASLRLQIREGKFREPDLLLLLDKKDPRRQNAYWLGADMVAEVVSPDNPERDHVVKRADYAEAGIPEYWIVNPEEETITVLRLAGDEYVEHGVFRRGEIATSNLIEIFAVSVDELFDVE